MADGNQPRSIPRPIRDHGIVGDMATAALVARDGAIDFMCWPRLDSPTIFAALLDPENGGEFALAPVLEGASATQLYVPDTNVLTTRWTAEAGVAEVTDFMPHPEIAEGLGAGLVRTVRALRGRVRFEARCRPRLNYARSVPGVEAIDQGVCFRPEGLEAGNPLRLSSSVALAVHEGEASADFWLKPGETAWFVLDDLVEEAQGENAKGEGVARTAPSLQAVADSFKQTAAIWRRWARRSTYRGRWSEQVTRSSLALKLLTSAKYGSVAAAATFGLPEATEAGRNWDYRATWIRDASFTVYAFMRLGYVEEADAFRHWVGRRIAGAAQRDLLHVLYAIDGDAVAEERTLDHLSGYGGSRPVRIGNAARSQTQLDIYGELLDSVYLSNKYGAAISHEGWLHVCEIVDQVRRHWRQPDAGIWEIRDAPREFLHSRLMCWVALDRAVRLAVKRSLPAPLVDWTRERDLISRNIWEHFRHPEKGYFVQTRGGSDLDAALLMMPLVRFVSATDPVWLSTLDAIGEQLADGALVFRYRNADGLTGGEGAFTACTFWYIECLARAGRLDEAHLLMERALGFANGLGLFSEEVSRTSEPLGNFPQALTHLAFISAAYFLDRKLSNPTGGVWQP